MKRLIYISIIVFAFVSCKKEYVNPPEIFYPDAGGTITIDSLRQLYQANGPISFTTDLDLYGIVTMDENDGNIYKSIYLQDHTSAINVRLKSGGGLYQGDSVRIALNGCYLNQFSGVMQLDSVDTDWNVVKQSSANPFAAEVTTIDQITTAKESELVQFNNVQFVKWQLNDTYADKVNQIDGDVLLEDVSGNTVVIRTSGYASFADQQVAQGSGSIVCIVSHFNGELQLFIRSYDEVNMSGARFTGLSLYKDFNDDVVTSDGWTTYQVIPSIAIWETSSAGGASNPYCQISNYNGSTNEAAETWLISPSLDLTGSTAPMVAFDNAWNYDVTAPPLEVYISMNYVSGDPLLATWTDLTGFANWSGGSWTWVNSGDIAISGFEAPNVHIAFRYQGSASEGRTYEIDNIIIKG